MQVIHLVLLLTLFSSHKKICEPDTSFSYIIRYPNSSRGEFLTHYFLLYSDSIASFRKLSIEEDTTNNGSMNRLTKLGITTVATSFYNDDRFISGCCEKNNDDYYLNNTLEKKWRPARVNLDSLLSKTNLWKVYHFRKSRRVVTQLGILKCKMRICKCKTGSLIESEGNEISYITDICQLKKMSRSDKLIVRKFKEVIGKNKP